MAAKLRVIVLLSGGKDSLFSAAHCVANGHQVVALANLYPSEALEAEDLDSFMYQTVGHAAIPLYEDALGIPLYRGRIVGTAVNTDQAYGKHGSHGDETESLADLLADVMIKHPEANAVCSGAILSSYQRTRVESVALRLGLIPLSFLWQYPLLPDPGAATLLNDMSTAGVDARIVKVASGGLDTRHLWLNVADTQGIARLRRDMGRFGEPDLGALLGEGGEYETLAVDGPAPLWKKKIEVDHEVVDGHGGVAIARVKGATLGEKKEHESPPIKIPGIWDTGFQRLRSKWSAHQGSTVEPLEPLEWRRAWQLDRPKESLSEMDGLVCISNLHSDISGSFSVQQDHVLHKLRTKLEQMALPVEDILTTTVFLRRIGDFVHLNQAYGQLLQRALPPARVTVALGDSLPRGLDLLLSIVACRGKAARRAGLHVQSRSYWAPANIGPYSQAIMHELITDVGEQRLPSKLAFCAGQIPLVPSTMQLLDANFRDQAMLALQHLIRVGRAVGVHVWTGAIAYMVAPDGLVARNQAETALRVWRRMHEDSNPDADEAENEADEDIAETQLYRPWARGRPRNPQTSSLLSPIPWISRLDYGEGDEAVSQIPCCVVAQVSELPRNASIEWVSQGLCLGEDEQGQGAKARLEAGANWHRLEDSLSGMQYRCLCVSQGCDSEVPAQAVRRIFNSTRIQQVELLCCSNPDCHIQNIVEQAGGQVIPCKSLWSEDGPCDYVLRWAEASHAAKQVRT